MLRLGDFVVNILIPLLLLMVFLISCPSARDLHVASQSVELGSVETLRFMIDIAA